MSCTESIHRKRRGGELVSTVPLGVAHVLQPKLPAKVGHEVAWDNASSRIPFRGAGRQGHAGGRGQEQAGRLAGEARQAGGARK